MNANTIFKGHEYAYVDYPSRNVTYYPGARRVRVMHVYKIEDEWRQRKQTLVEVEMLDNDTGERQNTNGDAIKTIRARQIVARWDEHVVEEERHVAERRELDERNRREREERQRQQEERLREYEETNDRIYEALANIGVPRSMITLNSYEVRISRHNLDEYLRGGVDNDNGEGVRQKSS